MRASRPQLIDQLIQRHHPPGMDEQRREHGSLLAPAQLHPASVAPRFDLTEESELDQSSTFRATHEQAR